MADNEPSNLITALKRHDRSAWSVAADRHLQEIYGFIFHLVGNDRAIAEDLNQETWLEAMGGIAQCDATRGSFRNWLFGIARNRVALYYRRRAVARTSTTLNDQFREATGWQDTSVLPEDVLEQVERISVVRAAILLVPDDRRQVLLGKYVEGHSIATIAARLGKTAKAVESLLSRARAQLRGLLREYMMPCSEEQAVSKELPNE